jgi:hypothetical protein
MLFSHSYERIERRNEFRKDKLKKDIEEDEFSS